MRAAAWLPLLCAGSYPSVAWLPLAHLTCAPFLQFTLPKTPQVYCIVTAETQRVKRERSKQAARAFVRRWSTIVEGMGGLAATAVTATRRRLAAAAHLPATAAKDGGGAAATGSASGSGGSTKESDGGGDPVAVGSCAPSEDSHGGGLQAASANGSATGLDQRRKSVQFSGGGGGISLPTACCAWLTAAAISACGSPLPVLSFAASAVALCS